MGGKGSGKPKDFDGLVEIRRVLERHGGTIMEIMHATGLGQRTVYRYMHELNDAGNMIVRRFPDRKYFILEKEEVFL